MLYYLIWVIAVLSLYIYLRKIYNKFATLGINNLPVIPIFGNIAPIVLKQDSIMGTIHRNLLAFPDDKVVGFYEFMSPLYLINDVELIKKITMKDFEHFVDRPSLPEEFKNPVFTKNLIALKGDIWRSMRLTLSPSFTGFKLRLMIPVMVEITNHMMDHVKNKINESEVHYIDVETKDMVGRCIADIFASCMYGIKVNSTEGDNEFYVNCKQASDFSSWDFLKMILMRSYPKAASMLNWEMKPELSKFFTELVEEVMTYRKEHNIVRNDVMHILKEANKAGFETVSSGLSFLLHELATHPDIQERLYQEIKENNESNNGNFDYNSVQTMTYLDMVLSEGLRLWPPVQNLERTCVKDYNIGKPNDRAKTDVIIRKDEEIWFNIWTLHRNPRYFPDPKKFDPERFSEENKHKIKPFTFIPFGAGARACIGTRFALMEMKVMLYILLLNIEVMSCERTSIPIRLAAHDAFLRIKGGYWLRIKLRS